MDLNAPFQLVLLLVGVSIILALLLDDDGPSNGGPRRKRKLAPVRVRTGRSRRS